MKIIINREAHTDEELFMRDCPKQENHEQTDGPVALSFLFWYCIILFSILAACLIGFFVKGGHL